MGEDLVKLGFEELADERCGEIQDKYLGLPIYKIILRKCDISIGRVYAHIDIL